MFASRKAVEIQNIFVEAEPGMPSADDKSKVTAISVRDKIIERIRRIAGKNSIKRIVPVQNHGDYKTQEVMFELDDVPFVAIIRYNNAMTEGSVDELKKIPIKC
jgi:hypothetical protein